MPATTETRKITINVDAGQSQAQLKAIADGISGMNNNTKSLADSFGFLNKISATFLAGLGIQKLISYSDQIQTLDNRLLALSGDQETASALLNQLAQASRDTNTSLQATADVFIKMSVALKEANINSSDMIAFTETLTNTFRLSGNSAEEASAAVTSLAYALQQGGLKGRELRTVLRENATLGQLLRQTFGGNIMQAANNGFITTSKIFQIIGDNMQDINTRAATLQATLGQSLTKAFDAFKVKVFEINQALGVSGGLASTLDLVAVNMGSVVTVGVLLAAGVIPKLVTQVYSLVTALLSLASPTIIGILGSGGFLVAGLAAVVSIFGNSSDIGDLINQLKVGFAELKGDVLDVFGTLFTAVSKFSLIPAQTAKNMADLGKATSDAAKDSHVHAQALEIEYEAAKDLATQQAKVVTNLNAAAQKAKVFKIDKTPFELLAELNAQVVTSFQAGTISVEQYNEKIQQVDLAKARKEFETGHKDLEALNEAFDKFQTYQLNTQLRDGIITFQQFDDSIRDIGLDKLNRQLAAGIISLEQYNTQLAAVQNKFSVSGAFRTGLQDYLNAIGTTTQQVAAGITKAFQNVEDSFISFIKTGKFNFDKFTQDILDDLLRIVIRATILAPLARGILSGIGYGPVGNSAGESAGATAGAQAAHGAIFGKNFAKFANGGVVSAPTYFGYSNNKTGLMGEAGPEAIIPLARGSGGDLGVKASITPVTVNIINQANGTEVSQSQTTGPNGDTQIDLLITSKVNQGFGTGKFDKALKQSFGLNRKGT